MIALAALLLVQSAGAATPSAPGQAEAQAGAAAVRTALRACDKWLLEPATWAGSSASFVGKAGLDGTGMTRVVTVPDVAMPPPGLRADLRHWRIPAGRGSLFVSVSETRPFCHLAGGAPYDMQPAVQAMLADPAFDKAWIREREQDRDGLRSGFYRYRADLRLTMGVTRAVAAGGPTDRVQFLATAQYDAAPEAAAPRQKPETGN